MLWTMMALAAASPVVGMANDCSGLPNIEASAPNLAALPPEIVRDLEYIIGEMPGDVGSDLHLVDATGLAPEATLIRIARTADAVDASFMTIFGEAEMLDQSVTVSAL